MNDKELFWDVQRLQVGKPLACPEKRLSFNLGGSHEKDAGIAHGSHFLFIGYCKLSVRLGETRNKVAQVLRCLLKWARHWVKMRGRLFNHRESRGQGYTTFRQVSGITPFDYTAQVCKFLCEA